MAIDGGGDSSNEEGDGVEDIVEPQELVDKELVEILPS